MGGINEYMKVYKWLFYICFSFMPENSDDRVGRAYYLMSIGLSFFYGTLFFSLMRMFQFSLISIRIVAPVSVILIFALTFWHNKNYLIKRKKYLDAIEIFKDTKRWLQIIWMILYAVIYLCLIVLLIVSAALYGKYVSQNI